MKILAFSLFLLASQAFAGDLELCNKAVGELNKRMPLHLDSSATVKSLSCKEKLRSIVVSYSAEVDSRKAPSQVFISELRELQREVWCKDPDMRKVLGDYNVETKYYLLPRNKYIGKTRITSAQCDQENP